MQYIFIALLFCLGFAAPTLAALPERQCAITASTEPPQEGEEQTVCPPLTPFMAIGTANYDAVRSNIGPAEAPIDVWNRCRYIDNDSTDISLFVPFRSEPEWDAFVDLHPTYMSLATCALPMTANLVPNADCADPSPASEAVNLPYARTGTVLSKSTTFTCAPPEEGCPGWTQTVQTNFTALNSDIVSPSWLAGAPTYLGSPPDLETCTIEGACGPAHGTAVSSAPTSGLCDAGDTTAVTGSGPWNWNCLGANGGSNATCTAPISAQAGVCGPANGVEAESTPSSGLCTTGTASAVSGSGPWTWTCAGIGGGSDGSCSAPIATPPLCDFNTWTPRETDRSWWGVASSSDGTKLVAVADSDSIYTSTDAGVTWMPQNSSIQNWYEVTSSSDGTKLAATEPGGRIYTSSDSGVTWTPRDSNRNWWGITASTDGTKLAAVASFDRIYTSTNSGVTWTPRESVRYWTDVASSADGTKLAATVMNGRIYTSTDSGVTWTARESNRIWSGIASSADGTKLAAIVTNGQIFTSTDSGATWTARESNRNWRGITSSSDGMKLAVAARGGQIYTSSDGGVTWTPHESNRFWIDVASSADGTKLVATVDGGQIYTSPCTVP